MRPRGEFRCHQETDFFSLLRGTGKSSYRSFVSKSGGSNLDRYMEPDAADTNPPGRRPPRPEHETELGPLDTHSEIDSIVLNAPIAEVYGYCCHFEELPRFITSVGDVRKIDESHFAFTSLLDGKESVLQIVLRVPERRIVWQATPENFPRGVVLFEPLSDRTTQITLRLRASIEPLTLAKVTRDYLENFKRFVEGRSTP